MQAEDTPERQANREKFSTELELVQALCNPFYLSYLAFQGVLESEDFVRYLSYLKYWTKPEYARFLHYPYATQMLELLQSATFRASFKNENMAGEVSRRLLQHWSTWRDAPASTSTQPPPPPPTVHVHQSSATTT